MAEYTTDLILKEGLEAIGYTEGKQKLVWYHMTDKNANLHSYHQFDYGRHAEQNDNIKKKQAV